MSGIGVYSHSEVSKGYKQTTNYSGLLDLTGVPTFLPPSINKSEGPES